MHKLQIIVFSFNRALQLDTLLYTFLEYWHTPSFELDVVYNTTSLYYQRGYELLIQKLSDKQNIKFYKEQKPGEDICFSDLLNIRNIKRCLQHSYIRCPRTNFRSLIIDLMEKSSAECVMFMTDDAMYVNDVYISDEMIRWISDNPKHNQYSLRVGIGMDDKNAHYIDNGEYLSWNFNREDGLTNWGYHFSVDAHIYAKNIIINLFKHNLFANPNSLEAPIREEAKRKGWLDCGRGPQKASILSFPINMVQTVNINKTLGVSIEMMNRYYLDGYTMRYPIVQNVTHFQQYPDSLLFYKDGKCMSIKVV